MLKRITNNPNFTSCKDEDEIVESLYLCDNFEAPFSMSDLYVMRDRYPIYVEFSQNKKSLMVESMKEHMGMTAIVADSIRQGRDGLFFVQVTPDFSDVATWLQSLTKKNVYCCETADTYYTCSPVHSFVNNSC
jgi:hypothetical protein